MKMLLESPVAFFKVAVFYFYCLLRFRLFRRQRHPQIVLELTGDYFGHEGRYLFLLLYFLAYSGSEIVLIRKLWTPRKFWEMGIYGRLAFEIKSVQFRSRLPRPRQDAILITDCAARAATAGLWRKILRIDCDIFKDRREFAPGKYSVISYSMHPKVYETESRQVVEGVQESDRNVRLFFSGNTEPKKYSGNPVTTRFNLLPRSKVIEFARGHLACRLVTVRSEAERAEVMVGDQRDKFVLIDDTQMRVQMEQWMSTLAHCDFFLCPPGAQMPLCHNAVEAMAAGAIPVLSYPDWFQPALEDRLNCLTFTTQQSLAEALDLVFSLRPEEIERMRRSVRHYYRTYLSPKRFAGWLESQSHLTVLLLNVESAPVLRRLQPESVYLSAGTL